MIRSVNEEGEGMKGLAVCVMCGIVITGTACTSAAQQRKVEAAPRVVAPATEEMQHAEFWISRIQNPDRVILTPAQIDELNRKNRVRSYDLKDVNGNPFSFLPISTYKDSTLGLQYHVENPLALKSFPGDSLRVRLERHRKSFNLENMYDRRQVKIGRASCRERV